MAATAFLFPGQGAPAGRWASAVRELRPDLIALATELVGSDPFERLGESTEYDQVAICCASLVAYGRSGGDADFHAGHSMGEIPALVCAGALSESDGVRLVAARGQAMAEAVHRSAAGSMLAVAAGPAELRELAASYDVIVANENSPEQAVLSGPERALEGLEAELRERGLRVKRLAVTGAFHTPAMSAAVEAFRTALARVEFQPPRVPVLSSATAQPFADPAWELAGAVTSPVRWLDVMFELERHGVYRFVEVGPGKALSGLVRRTIAGAEVEQVPLPEEVAHG